MRDLPIAEGAACVDLLKLVEGAIAALERRVRSEYQQGYFDAMLAIHGCMEDNRAARIQRRRSRNLGPWKRQTNALSLAAPTSPES